MYVPIAEYPCQRVRITSYLIQIKPVLYVKAKCTLCVNVNIRMYNFDDVQCTVIPSVAYGFVTGMNLQLC